MHPPARNKKRGEPDDRRRRGRRALADLHAHPPRSVRHAVVGDPADRHILLAVDPDLQGRGHDLFLFGDRRPPHSTPFPYTTLFRSKCLLKLKRLVSILPMTKSKK